MKISSNHEEVNSKFYTIDRIRKSIKNESIPVFEKCYDIIAVPKIDTLNGRLKESIQQYIPLKQVHCVSKLIHTYDSIKLYQRIRTNVYHLRIIQCLLSAMT